MACASCGGKRIHGRRPNSPILLGNIEDPDVTYQVSVINTAALPGFREGDIVYLRGDGASTLIANGDVTLLSTIN